MDINIERKTDEWLEIDNLQNAIISLEMAVECIGKIPLNLLNWKWVIIGTHDCLQNFMVLALRGSMPVNIMSEKNAKRWLKAYDKKEKLPNYRMDSFLNLYDKIKSNRMLMYTNSKKYTPTGSEDRHVESLNRLRNSFTHFHVGGWSLYTGGLQDTILDVFRIIEFLAFESNNLNWPDEHTQEEVQRLLLQGRNDLAKL
jgi:hypothetical protein